MKKANKCASRMYVTRTTWFAFFLIFISASEVHAYIDPGTGLLVWQLLFSIAGGIIIFLRNPLSAVKSFVFWVRNKRKKK